jgi:hypothetical protein
MTAFTVNSSVTKLGFLKDTGSRLSIGFGSMSTSNATTAKLVRLQATTTESVLTMSPLSTTTSFDPIVPDAAALAGFAVIVVLCIVAGWVWQIKWYPSQEQS